MTQQLTKIEFSKEIKQIVVRFFNENEMLSQIYSDLRDIPSTIECMCRYEREYLEKLPNELKDNLEFVKLLVKADSENIRLVSKRIKFDPKFLEFCLDH